MVCNNLGNYNLQSHNCQNYVQELVGAVGLLHHDANKYYNEPKTTLDCVFGRSTSTDRAASASIRSLLWSTAPLSPAVSGFDALVCAVDDELQEEGWEDAESELLSPFSSALTLAQPQADSFRVDLQLTNNGNGSLPQLSPSPSTEPDARLRNGRPTPSVPLETSQKTPLERTATRSPIRSLTSTRILGAMHSLRGDSPDADIELSGGWFSLVLRFPAV
jgi:hypothetical protein